MQSFDQTLIETGLFLVISSFTTLAFHSRTEIYRREWRRWDFSYSGTGLAWCCSLYSHCNKNVPGNIYNIYIYIYVYIIYINVWGMISLHCLHHFISLYAKKWQMNKNMCNSIKNWWCWTCIFMCYPENKIKQIQKVEFEVTTVCTEIHSFTQWL